MENRRTALYDKHLERRAKIVPFASWDMPLNYTAGAVAEHHAVRRSAGMFDTSHMGRLFFRGRDAARALDSLISSNILDMAPMSAQYGLLCRSDGTIIDDVFVYRLEPGPEYKWMVVVNAANHERDVAWMRSQIPGIDIDDRTPTTTMLAVQGPKALAVLEAAGDVATAAADRFAAVRTTVGGIDVLSGRTGYTGEEGAELYCASEHGPAVWDALFSCAEKAGIEFLPCGLASRDSLRFEAGFPLYGHELTDTTTPVEARLTWACHLDRPFVGSEVIQELKRAGRPTRLVTFTMIDRAVPRQGYTVHATAASDASRAPSAGDGGAADGGTAGDVIGTVVSGMYAPTVDAYCGNAYVLKESSRTGTQLQIDIRTKRRTAAIVKRPLYLPVYRR